jgi:fructose-1,6-bisphosphatase/inositol monophosphatase family enzyme
VVRKADRSLVTDVDKESERIVADRIREAFPKHRIVAEEGSVGASGGEWVWVVDPLDGTHNYIRGIPIYGVSIGIVYRDEFVGGVIYLPSEGALLAAEKGSGAYLNDNPVHVSSCDTVEEVSLSFDSSIRADPAGILKVLERLSQSVFNVRMFGASVRIFSYLAQGKLDAAVEFDDKPWDFAGGVCVLREAGGRITQLDGAPLGTGSVGYVASNGRVQGAILDVVRAVYPAHGR